MLLPVGGLFGHRVRVAACFGAAIALALAFASSALAAETLVGSGFESGADGAAVSAPWTLSGAPQRAEFDSAQAKVGSLSGWIQGPAAASYAGFGETVSGGMASSGAEQRFWVYCDTANEYRVIDDWSATTAERAFSLQLDTAGNVNVYTNRVGVVGYTSATYIPVGTYTAGWTEYRIVYDFATQSYQLSKRTVAGGAWTQMKSSTASSYAIPFRGVNTISQSHGILWRAYNGADLWVDDVRYSDSGMADADVAAPTAPASLIAADVPGDSGGAIALSWTASTDNIGVTGYKVYRGTAPGVYGTPTAVFSGTSYSDASAVTGTRYYYAVAALDAAGNESPKSPEATAVALDNLAPAAPTGLAAVGGSKSVAVSWSANSESDLAGYNVYRNGTKVNSSLLTGTSLTDTGRADGTTYTYVVRAVDVSGNESAASASVSATTEGTASSFDGTFESGADGAALPSPWVLSGTPQRAEYDNARFKNGALSAWIQGPAAATYAGAGETVSGSMTSSGAEQRLWIYFDTNNQFRVIDDWSATTADRAFTIQFDTAGAINVYTNRSGVTGYASAAYTPVGTYSAGWTELRIVYDFATQAYQLSKRASATDSWTQLKSSGASTYAIPFRGANTITQSHGLLLRAYNGASMWLDDMRYGNEGISDGPAPDTTAPAAPASLVAADVPADSGGKIALSWAAATDNVAVTGYRVYRGTSAGSYGTPTTVFSGTTYTDAAAVTGTRYYYAVTAIDAAGNEGARSPEASAVALDNLGPTAPSGLVAVGGSRQVALTWSANAESDLAGYNVYRNGAKANATLVTAAAFTDTGLADATGYTYTVKAVDASGNESAASSQASATTSAPSDTTPPVAPAGLSATGGARQVVLAWSANTESDLAGYNVYRAGVKLNAALVTSAAYTDAGLSDGTAYSYTVKAVDATGNESAASAVASATTTGTPPAPSAFDATFESGTDAASVAAGGWIISGTPQRAEYDSAQKKGGALSGWIQGPASAAYAGFGETSTAGMSASGAEQRFWVYVDTTNQYRVIDDWSALTADRAFTIQFSTSGTINVFTNRVGNPNGYTTAAYTQVGTYAAGWTEYRVVYDFASQTYQLSKRTSAADPWTQLKAASATGYAIPFRGVNTVTSSHGLLFRAYQGANMWVDDLYFGATGVVSHAITATTGTGGTISPASQSVYDGADSAAFTITPNAGYEIAGVTVDGASVGTPATYTFTKVASAHSINATFKVAAVSGDMSTEGIDCDTCHASHGFDLACGECHEMRTFHPGTPTQMHVAADVTECSPCHDASLTLEHNGRTTASGDVIGCATCHQSADARVSAAIAAKDSSCSTCHDATGHQSSHTFTPGSDLVTAGDAGCTNSGTGCHGTDASRASFTTYHPNTGCLTGACHKSASKASYAGDGDCQTCHDGAFVGAPNRSPLAAGHYSETTHTAAGMTATVTSGGSASATCATCHPTTGGLVAQHTGVGPAEGSTYGTTVACGECHNDTRTNGNAVVKANWTARTCAACHTASSSAPMHSATSPVVTTTSGAGCGASGSGCHSTYDVHALHKNSAGGCTLAGCHDSSKQAAKPTLKACGETGGCHTTEGTDFHTKMSVAHTSTTIASCFATGCHTSKNLVTVHTPLVGAGNEFAQYASACELCHDNDSADRVNWSTATSKCASCHNEYHDAPVGTRPVHADRDALHTPTSASALCTKCHSASLQEIHGRTYFSPTECMSCHNAMGSGNAPCAKCHASASNWSKSADCSSCHDISDVGALHPNMAAAHTSSATTQSCLGNCHEPSLLAEHARTSATRSAVTCEGCHDAKVPALGGAWNGTCDACHTPQHSDMQTSGNGRCFECHGTDPTAIAKVGTASTYVMTGGDHQTGYDASAHGTKVAPGSDGGSATGVQCEACHSHKADGVTHRADYRTTNASSTVAEAQLCYECHSASAGGSDISPNNNAWNGRDVKAEFARASHHPVMEQSPTSLSTPETQTVFSQSTQPEFALDDTYQTATASEDGPQLYWGNVTMAPRANQSMLFVTDQSGLSQYDRDISAGLSSWNDDGYNPPDMPAGKEPMASTMTTTTAGRALVVLTGGSPQQLWQYELPNATNPSGLWSQVATLVTSGGTSTNPVGADLAYDAKRNLVYGISGSGSTNFFVWDPMAKTMTSRTIVDSNGTAIALGQGACIAVSELPDALWFVRSNGQGSTDQGYLYKVALSDGQSVFTGVNAGVRAGSWGGTGEMYTKQSDFINGNFRMTRFRRNGADFLYLLSTCPDHASASMVTVANLDATATIGWGHGYPWQATSPNNGFYTKRSDIEWDGGNYVYMTNASIPTYYYWGWLPAIPSTVYRFNLTTYVFENVTPYTGFNGGTIAFGTATPPGGTPGVGYASYGTVTSPEISPQVDAVAWGKASYSADVPTGTALSVKVQGKRDGNWEDVAGYSSIASGADLSAISVTTYPQIRLVARLSTTDQANLTPRLLSWNVSAARQGRPYVAQTATVPEAAWSAVTPYGANTHSVFTGTTQTVSPTYHTVPAASRRALIAVGPHSGTSDLPAVYYPMTNTWNESRLGLPSYPALPLTSLFTVPKPSELLAVDGKLWFWSNIGGWSNNVVPASVDLKNPTSWSYDTTATYPYYETHAFYAPKHKSFWAVANGYADLMEFDSTGRKTGRALQFMYTLTGYSPYYTHAMGSPGDVVYSPSRDKVFIASTSTGKLYSASMPTTITMNPYPVYQTTEMGLPIVPKWDAADFYSYNGQLVLATVNGYEYLFYFKTAPDGTRTMTLIWETTMSPWWGSTTITLSGTDGGSRILWDGEGAFYSYGSTTTPGALSKLTIPTDVGNPTAWGPWTPVASAPGPWAGNYSLVATDVPMGAFETTGYATTTTTSPDITPAATDAEWGWLTWTGTEPAGTDIRMTVQGWNGTQWVDTPIASKTTSPVDLGSLRTGTWPKLRVVATLACDDYRVAPTLSSWNVTSGTDETGYFSTEIAPQPGATKWGRLNANATVPDGTSATVSVSGWNGTDFVDVPGFTNLPARDTDLTSLKVSDWPRLRLVGRLTRNASATADASLDSWGVTSVRPETYTAAQLACASCHEPHTVATGGEGAWDFSRVSDPSNTKSTAVSAGKSDATAFCTSCHGATTPAPDATLQAWVPWEIRGAIGPEVGSPVYWSKEASGAAFTASGHYNSTSGRTDCATCHDPHGSDNARLTAWTLPSWFETGTPGVRANTASAAGEENLCYQCHGNGTVGKQAPGAQDVATPASSKYAHPIGTSGRHVSGESASALGGANRHSECTDCHDPHAAKSGTHTVGSSQPGLALTGAWGVQPLWTSGSAAGATSFTTMRFTGQSKAREAYLCFKCHSGYTNLPAKDQLNGYGGVDLTEGFNPSNPSYHNVLGLSTGVRTSFSYQGAVIAWPFYNTLKSPWTTNSSMTCTDCHTNETVGMAKGPHGSTAPFMLDPAYPDDWKNAYLNQNSPTGVTGNIICTKCHTFMGTNDNPVHNSSGISAPRVHANYNFVCTSCHVRIPHGWKRPRMLGSINDPAPYRSTSRYKVGLIGVGVRTRPDGTWNQSDCSVGCSSTHRSYAAPAVTW